MALRGTGVEAIRVVGLNALTKMFKEVGGDALRASMKEAGKESGEIVAQESRRQVPVRTGDLKRTIRVAPLMRKVEVRSGKAAVPYAKPIHWGWFYDKKRMIYKNIKPNPFMSRALGYTREEVTANYQRNIDKMLEKQAAIERLRAETDK